MIKVSVMYPNTPESTFNIEYYCNEHMPLVGKLFGKAMKSSAVVYGLAGAAPGEAAPFIAIGHMVFDSVESFQHAFALKAEEIMTDLPNFTNIQPQIQISEIKI